MEKQIRKITHPKGITLIALVVTIVVLIILATISISIVFGEEGIIVKAREAQEAQKKATAKEKVQLMIADYIVEREISTEEITIFDYMTEQKNKGNLDSVKQETIDNKEKVVVETDGYEIEIDVESIEVDIAGEEKNKDVINVSVWNIPDGIIEHMVCYWADTLDEMITWEEYIEIATPQNDIDTSKYWLEVVDGYINCRFKYSENQIREFKLEDINGENVLASETVKSGEYYFTVRYAECVFPDSEILISKNNETILAKNIKEGDNIVYLNLDLQELEMGKVTKVYIHKKATSFVKYTFEDGSYLEATDYHPIYTKQGWKSYTQRNGYDVPQIGDEIKTPTSWKKLIKLESWTGEVDCYDFVITNERGEKIDNYFANGTLVQGSY